MPGELWSFSSVGPHLGSVSPLGVHCCQWEDYSGQGIWLLYHVWISTGVYACVSAVGLVHRYKMTMIYYEDYFFCNGIHLFFQSVKCRWQKRSPPI